MENAKGDRKKNENDTGNVIEDEPAEYNGGGRCECENLAVSAKGPVRG